MDAILIEGLELTCIVGLRPHERVRKQAIELDLELELDLAPAGRSCRIAYTCDYDLVTDSVRSLLFFREYHLIEVATEELAAMLLGLFPALERVRIRIAKPTALVGRARSAAVRIERARHDFPRRCLTLAHGEIDVLLETREAGLYTWRFMTGGNLAEALREAARSGGRRATAWVVGGSLTVARDELGPGALVNLETMAEVTNAREEPATVFVCTTPALDLARLSERGLGDPRRPSPSPPLRHH